MNHPLHFIPETKDSPVVLELQRAVATVEESWIIGMHFRAEARLLRERIAEGRDYPTRTSGGWSVPSDKDRLSYLETHYNV